MQLTPAQAKELREALARAFDRPSFAMLLTDIGVHWPEPHDSLRFEAVVHLALLRAETDRWLPLLVRAARAARPKSEELAAWVEKCPGIEEPSVVQATRARRLFICYRREDAQDAAGRLHDRLVEAYGQEGVFMDIDSVPLGIDFVEHVADQISRCSAIMVVIGKQWLKVKDKQRRRRLDNDDDPVRMEIAAALQQKTSVIPVFVQDAEMPRSNELPENIRPLARRNGISLSATRWRTDVERLIKELDRVMKPSGDS